MQPLYSFLDLVRDRVRAHMNTLARGLNKLSRGKLTPSTVTAISFLLHLPIAWLIAEQQYPLAAVLLIVFGLMDALDGALARIQGTASNAGMLLDASSDRMKEVILYTGAVVSFVREGRTDMVAWAVIACGASICVSYIKAKGETAVAGGKLTANEVNRLFQDGLGRYEIRMFILVVGLLTGRVILAVVVIALLSVYTSFERLIKISRSLSNNVQD